MDTRQTIQYLKGSIYDNLRDDQINIFLCGAKTSSKNSLRKLIEDSLKDATKVNIVFPEWLFGSLMTNREYDLLSLEKDLAKNVDLIVLPLEGIGAICELGAFASFAELTGRIIVLNDGKYRTDRSFVNEGPIKLIKKVNRDNIIYFEKSDLAKAVNHVKNRIVHFKKDKTEKSLDNLFNLSRFLGYVIAFMQPIRQTDIKKHLADWDPALSLGFLEPSIEILVNKGHISVDKDGNDELLTLTREGLNYYISGTGAVIGDRRGFLQRRAVFLWTNHKRKRTFDLAREKKRSLEIG